MNQEKIAKMIEMTIGEKTMPFSTQKGGVLVKGFTIGNESICPTFYYDDSAEKSEQEIADEIINNYHSYSCKETERECMKQFVNDLHIFEKVKGKIIPCLRPLINERDENIVSFDFEDLEMYFRVTHEDMSVVITKGLMYQWNTTEDTIKTCAVSNIENNKDWFMVNMNYVMEEMFGLIDDISNYAWEQGDAPMYVLSNNTKVNGSGAICSNAILKKVAEVIADDFYVIPSSIHECLIVPFEYGNTIELNEMVCEVNEMEVAEHERLANHVYLYTRETETLKCA